MDFSLNKPRLRALVGYLLGLILTLATAFLCIWPDLESTVYGFTGVGDASLATLHCPDLLAAYETGAITARVKNRVEQPRSMFAEIEISGPGAFRTDRQELKLAAGESGSLSWTISRQDIDLGNFIFASVYVYANYPDPSRIGRCGAWVVHSPIPGAWLLALLIALSAGLVLLGLAQWERSFRPLIGKPRDLLYGFTFVAIFAMLAIFFGIQGAWMIGIICLVVVVLGASAVAVFAVNR